jgi:hypothetical protein
LRLIAVNSTVNAIEVAWLSGQCSCAQVLAKICGPSLLKHHMAQHSDFQDKETLMQHHGKSPGVKVDQTPKCHCKMAGEGLEHSWARAKGFHCRLIESKIP